MKNLVLLIVLISATIFGCTNRKEYRITSYGAKADGISNNAVFIQKAIDEASEKGGGKVLIPPGNFATGVIVLKSGECLHLELGACLLGSVKRTDYNSDVALGLIVAEGQTDISISGRGVIDGQAGELVPNIIQMLRAGTLSDIQRWQTMRPSEATRPMLILFKDCKDVNIQGITLKNSASWVQKFDQCKGLTIDGIRVESTAYWNNDGIDITDCKDVNITNCYVNSADDGICLKSEDPNGLCENIYIADCTIRSSASAFKLGTASYGGFRNVKVRNLKIFDTYRSAIAIESVDGGILENIDIQNVSAKNTGNAIFIRLGHRNKTGKVGELKNIYIANVKAEIPLYKPDQGYPVEGPPDIHGPQNYKNIPARRSGYPSFGHPWLPYNLVPSSIVGIPGYPVENVILENIEITYAGGANKEIAHISVKAITSVNEWESNYPEFSMFGELPAWGFYIRHVEGITMNNICIKYLEDDFRPAFVFDDVSDLKLKDVSIPTVKDLPVIVKNNVTTAHFENIKIPVDEKDAILELQMD